MRGQGDAERLGRLEIQDHFEPSYPLHGQLGGTGTLENLVHEVRGPAPHLDHAHLVTDETARLGELLVPDRWIALLHGQPRDIRGVGGEHGILLDGHRIHAAPRHGGKRPVDSLGLAGLEALVPHLQRLGRELRRLAHDLDFRIFRIEEDTELVHPRQGILEGFEPVGRRHPEVIQTFRVVELNEFA